ncbi:peroxisomal membrane protein 11A-like isoform X2 [Ochotona curzoniae]|uniref:peroxisomal membrane protein 11A isoform X2 n=1 Tax=Ochotona curzoniae TaxID=130825 RepID=UPI001B35019C|nr:peroxisomal membrane protein 11A isoform X2 [Ochotona curzoniae]XP_040854102.1 peroxisomal membrane protein 11A-like isoform X2 [Ochotona curzoniae]
MDAFTRFTNQTQGRDRLFRATQYACMLLSYLLEPKAGKEEVVMKLKKLESSVSAGRKSNLNRVIYFICDTMLWVKSVGLVAGISKEAWRRRAARHYYYFLLLSLARDVYEISLQMGRVAHDRAKKEKGSSQSPSGFSVADEETEWLQSFLLLLFRSLKRHPPLLLDTVKNLCDILIPLSQLGIYKSNRGLIGLGGFVSSVTGIITVAYPHMKLRTC